MYFYKKIMFIQYIWFPFLSCPGFMYMFSNFLCYGELKSLILWKLLCLLVPLSCVLHRHLLSTRRVDTCTTTPFDCFVLFCFVLFQISGWETCCCFQQCLITSAITQQLCAQWGTMTFFFFLFSLLTCWDIRLFFCRKIALFQIKASRALEIPLSVPRWSKRMATRYSL